MEPCLKDLISTRPLIVNAEMMIVLKQIMKINHGGDCFRPSCQAVHSVDKVKGSDHLQGVPYSYLDYRIIQSPKKQRSIYE